MDTDNKIIESIHSFVISDSNRIMKYINVTEEFIFEGLIYGICTNGLGRVSVNNRIHQLMKNHTLLITPHSIVKGFIDTADFELKLVFISLEYFLTLPLRMDKEDFMMMNEVPVLQRTDNEINDLLSLFQTLRTFKKKDLVYQEAIVNSLLLSYMLIFSSYYKKDSNKGALQNASKEDKIAREFVYLILTYFKTEKQLSFYANKLCLTSNYLSSIVKKVTGHSFEQWKQIVITIESKNLLKTTDMSIVEIADHLNFPNASFFGTFFKKQTGVTPKAYRDSVIKT